MTEKNVAAPKQRERPARIPRGDRPDPRPARLMVGAGALAAVTIIGAGLVEFPPVVAEEPGSTSATTDAAKAKTVKKTKKVKRPVKYVRLKPGQKAPKGAKVIKEAAPTPRVVVQRVVTRASSRSTRSVARSKQSG